MARSQIGQGSFHHGLTNLFSEPDLFEQSVPLLAAMDQTVPPTHEEDGEHGRPASTSLREALDSKMRHHRLNHGPHYGGPPFTALASLEMIIQLAHSLNDLHGYGAVYPQNHRSDVRASNIVVQYMPSWWPSDTVLLSFGPNEDPDKDELMPQLWRAPEVVKSLEDGKPLPRRSWQAADIYSFGMVCYEILSGEIPEVRVMTAQYYYDSNYDSNPVSWSGARPNLPAGVSETLRNIINRCWHPDSDSRPSFADIVHFLKNVLNYQLACTSLRAAQSFENLSRHYISEPTELDLSELEQLVVSHTGLNQSPDVEINGVKYLHWAFDFVSTAKKFFRKCWKTEQQAGDSEIQLTLPLSTFIQSWSLLVLMRNQMEGYFAHTPRETSFLQSFLVNTRQCDYRQFHEEEAEVMVRMARLYQPLYERMMSLKVREDASLTFNDKLSILQAGVYQNLLWNESTTCFTSLFWERIHVGTSVLATIDDIIQRSSNDVNEVERLKLSTRKDLKRHIFKRGIVNHVTSYSLGTVVPILYALVSGVPLLYLGYLLYWLFGGNKVLFFVTGFRISGFREVFLGYFAILILRFRNFLFCLLGLAYGWKLGVLVCVIYHGLVAGIQWGMSQLFKYWTKRY